MYHKNLAYFSTPNLQNSYWAGFIAADGCLASQGKKYHEPSRLIIDLAIKDIDHLRDFVEDVEYEGPVIPHDTTASGKAHNAARLSINGVHQWAIDLHRHYRVTPRKSLTLQPPEGLPEEMALAYIKGLIDGDGSVVWVRQSGRPYLRLYFLGTQMMMDWVRGYCDRLAPQKSGRVASVRATKSKVHSYMICGLRALRFLNLLRELPTRALPRKTGSDVQTRWDEGLSLRSHGSCRGRRGGMEEGDNPMAPVLGGCGPGSIIQTL